MQLREPESEAGVATQAAPCWREWTERFERSLLALDSVEARNLMQEACRAAPALEAVDRMVAPALDRIGAHWETGYAALSQVYMAGRICQGLVAAVLPHNSPARAHQPRLAVTVLQDYHSLGKSLVASALRAGGYDPLDLGHTNVEELVRRTVEEKLEVLLISTLMLPSALKVKDVRARLRAAGRHVKIVVGGAPFRFDPDLWREVGADACGYNALDAIEIVRRLTAQGDGRRDEQ